jgi:hypothetical protein
MRACKTHRILNVALNMFYVKKVSFLLEVLQAAEQTLDLLIFVYFLITLPLCLIPSPKFDS